MTPAELQAIRERDARTKPFALMADPAKDDRRALLAELDRVTKLLRDLLDDMAEDKGQRHARDKYRVYQISPDAVDAARAALAPKDPSDE